MDSMTFLNLEYVFYKIYEFFTSGGLFSFDLIDMIRDFLIFLIPYSVIISLLLITGIVYCYIRINQIRKEENEKYYKNDSIPDFAEQESMDKVNVQWTRVQDLISSENENDWKQAIIEADIMLNDILIRMGYLGEGVGERLKQVERSDFKTLDKAWEAHKMRNAIAHEGEHVLTQRNARKTINQFKEVFEEFHYI